MSPDLKSETRNGWIPHPHNCTLPYAFRMREGVVLLSASMKELISKLEHARSDRRGVAARRTRLHGPGGRPTSGRACARAVRKAIYGNAVFTRGLIEISNICKNDCLYCGIRRSNARAERYRLTPEEILACADEGYALGFRTFVLQGGEDPFFTDAVLCGLIREIKRRHPDCAVTLSLGERSRASFQRAFRRRGGPLPAAPRDRRPRALREAAPAGDVLRAPHAMPARAQGDRLPGGLRLHGGLALPDAGGAGKGFEVYRGVPAGHVRHRPVHPPPRHALRRAGPPGRWRRRCIFCRSSG